MSVVAIALKIFNYFTAVSILSYGLFLYAGYGAKNWWTSPQLFRQAPALIDPFYESPQNVPSAERGTEMYRGDIRRTGFFNQKISLNLVETSLSEVKNLGIHSASKASPLLTGNDFILATDGGQLARLNPEGKILWNFRTTKAKEGFHSTPVFYNGQIIAGDYSGLLISLNSQSGKMIWGLPLGNAIGASPLITPDHKILVSVEINRPDGFIAKVDASSGKIEWLSPFLGEQGHSSVALSWNETQPENSILIFGDNAHYLSAVDYATGGFLWRQKVGGPIKSTAALSDKAAYISSWDGYLYAYDIKNGTMLWRKKIETNNQSSAAILNQKNLGFILSSKGLCRFSLKETKDDIFCSGDDNRSAEKKASPIITRSLPSEVASGFIVWAPCKKSYICAYDLNLKLLKKWPTGVGISGEIRPTARGLMAMTEGDSGLILLNPRH